MDTLIYHHEIANGDLPDSCVRCGAGGTELTRIVLTTSIPVLGGAFQSSEVALPMCPEHVKAPIVSLKYPGVREFTEEGIVIKNVSAEFVAALAEHREVQRRERQARGEPEPSRMRIAPAGPVQLSPERERAYRRFVMACIVAAILGGAAIGGIVLVVVPKNNNRPPNAAPKAPPPKGVLQNPGRQGPGPQSPGRDLAEPPGFGPPNAR
jgi:hypothetical protein